jgi:hypothetical protein
LDYYIVLPTDIPVTEGSYFFGVAAQDAAGNISDITVKQYKSGPIHEYILNQVERRIGALSPKFVFQRHSEIAREHRIEPDSVLNFPGGQRVIIEICCTDIAYKAANLVRERSIDGVDMVLAITANARLKEALSRAVERCAADGAAAGEPRPLVLLDAGECLDKRFDWVAVFERPL